MQGFTGRRFAEVGKVDAMADRRVRTERVKAEKRIGRVQVNTFTLNISLTRVTLAKEDVTAESRTQETGNAFGGLRCPPTLV